MDETMLGRRECKLGGQRGGGSCFDIIQNERDDEVRYDRGQCHPRGREHS